MKLSTSLGPRRRREHILRIACGLALFALVLIVWSVLRPTPLPVLVALTLGQILGTASFATYLIIVAVDLGVRRKLGTDERGPASIERVSTASRAPSERDVASGE